MIDGWHFAEALPNQKAREPQVDKFFGSDVVVNFANALVREGIQNSLDAKDKSAPANDPVAVQVRMGEIVLPGIFETFTTGLWDHLTSQDDDQLPTKPSTPLPCRYLAFEDFGTRGLCGSPQQCWPDEDPNNAFFNFFRAEGHSEKREDARGRHGLGKHVFARASRARCFFGLTQRVDDHRQLLMGAAVLRMHKVGAKRFVPDGWYGTRRASDGFVLPIEERSQIQTFVSAFGLARNALGKPGLSIVVPWLESSITLDEVLDAVLRGYFWPILAGQLVVTVVDDAAGIVKLVDAGTIRDVLGERGEELRNELQPRLELARFGLSITRDQFLRTATPPSKPEWKIGLLSDEVKAKLRQDIESLKQIALRIPVRVKTKKAGSTEHLSHFDILLSRDPRASEGDIVFIREGLIVSDARPRATPGVRALVIINEGPLATFLGDAENPAHTQWQKSLVDGKYTYPDDRIRFVVQSVPKLLGLLSADQQQPDPSIWLDLFSIPADHPDLVAPEGAAGSRKGPEPVKPPISIPPVAPKRYRIDKTPGGFILRKGAPGTRRPYAVFIRVAYDLRRGNAFKNYTPDDFMLDRPPIQIDEGRGVDAKVGQKKNELLVRITDDDFELEVSGFGVRRDLITDPRLIPDPPSDEDRRDEILGGQDCENLELEHIGEANDGN